MTDEIALQYTRKKFLKTDLVAAINQVSVDVTDFTSEQINVAYPKYASLTFYVKGNHASCSKEIVFKFATFDSQRSLWDTEEWLSVSLAASGTSPRQKTINLNPDVEKVKILSIQNQETVSGYTVDANVSIFMK
jgi:hypothetical protein